MELFQILVGKDGRKIEDIDELKAMGKDSKQVIENDEFLCKISLLIPIYCKWHFLCNHAQIMIF